MKGLKNLVDRRKNGGKLMKLRWLNRIKMRESRVASMDESREEMEEIRECGEDSWE